MIRMPLAPRTHSSHAVSAVVMILAAAGAACSSDGATEPKISSQLFTLTRVNNHALPLHQGGLYGPVFRGGTLQANSDASYSMQAVGIPAYVDSGPTVSSLFRDVGTYLQSGSTLIFKSSLGPPYSGTRVGGVISVTGLEAFPSDTFEFTAEQ